MIPATVGRGRKKLGLKPAVLSKKGPFHPTNLEHHPPQKRNIIVKSAVEHISPNPTTLRPSSRSRSRSECLENSSGGSLPILQQQPRLPAAMSKSCHADTFITNFDTASAIKLPTVDHLPKLQHQKGQPNEEDLKKRKSRSKKLKHKILGSSDANLLPDKYGIIKVEDDGSGGLNVKLEKGTPLSSSEKCLPRTPPLVTKPSQEDNPRKKQLLRMKKERNSKPYPLKIVPGKVDIRPVINKDIWSRLHAGQKSQQLQQQQQSRSKKEIVIEKPQPVTSSVMFLNGRIPPGGQMQMESRSVQKIILKPVVSPDRQVIRRKTKFMENQALRDVYSLSQTGSRGKDGNLSLAQMTRMLPNGDVSSIPNLSGSYVQPVHVIETTVPKYNYRPHHSFHNLSQSGGRPGIHRFPSSNPFLN